MKQRFVLHLLVVLFALVFVASARAQSILETDAVSYRYDSTHALIEVYYGVLERGLAFKQVGKTWLATANAKAEVWQNGSVIQKKDISDTVRCDCTKQQLDSAGANKLLGVTGFSVPYKPGTVAVFIWQRGMQSGKPLYDTIGTPIALPEADASKFSFGGIELASAVNKSSGAPSPFEKVGYIVTPNPSLIFGDNYTKLFYYSELYVPQPVVDPTQNVDVVTSIVDPTGKEIVSTTQKQPLNGTTIPLMIGIDIDGLASDSYKLVIKAKYEDAVVAQTQKTFFYTSDMKISEEAPTASTDMGTVDEDAVFAASDFSKMSESELDERLAQSLYLAPDADRKMIKKLSAPADKQKFLYHFWRQQDALHHAQHPLDIYHEYVERINEVNKQFTYQKTPGWKTSMGRVYLTYGPPPTNGIEKHLFESGARPYIYWDYNIDPNMRLTSGNHAHFVFVDRQGGGLYYLVDSNVIGETSEPDWYTREALQLSH